MWIVKSHWKGNESCFTAMLLSKKNKKEIHRTIELNLKINLFDIENFILKDDFKLIDFEFLLT